MANYGIDDIESLSFRDGVRKRIQMYLGSATTEGLWQGLKEIINNSTDEALAGYGDKIVITIKEKDQEFSVRDYGRSVPFGIRDNGENVLVSIFSKAHTGGKFSHKAYAQAVGCNGIGASATSLSAEYFQVESYRDGVAAIARFEEGNNVSYEEKPTKEPNGTFVCYKPSLEVFIDAEEPLTYNRVCDEVENISYLNSGVKFIVKDIDNKSQKEFFSKDGIIDFIKNKCAGALVSKPIFATAKDATDEIEVALCWTKGKESSYCFVNGGYCNEGGTPITAIKTAITNSMKKHIGKDIDAEIFRRGLCYVANCKVANPSFEGQVKNKILNNNLRSLANKAAKEALDNFVNTGDFTVIADSIKKFAKAEKAADKAREAILTAATEVEKMRTTKGLILDKVSDAKILGLNSTLLICEGRSAKGSAKKGRDKNLHGIFEARGKMINPLTCSEEKFLKNNEIQQLQAGVGFDYGKPLNLNKLRYGHIDFFVDPDTDGAHIFLLGLTVIWRICPEFIKQGRVGWYHAPLFIVENKGKKKYFYTDEEYNEKGRSLPGTVHRVKGIGLLEKDELEESIFNCAAAHEVFEYTPEAMQALEALMGADVQPRKDFVFSNIDFSKYGEM